MANVDPESKRTAQQGDFVRRIRTDMAGQRWQNRECGVRYWMRHVNDLFACKAALASRMDIAKRHRLSSLLINWEIIGKQRSAVIMLWLTLITANLLLFSLSLEMSVHRAVSASSKELISSANHGMYFSDSEGLHHTQTEPEGNDRCGC